MRSLEVAAHNLPIQLTRFIGREREMAESRRLLAGNPLVTLTGTGGCGKTRLALQVTAELVEEYPDGVWLVELAPLADPALVPQAVASVLGIREDPGRPLPATLAEALRPRQLLLVLDNCEHLVEACARLVEVLLQTCPQLRILATSREALGIAGETVWPVPSLSLPDPHRLPPSGEGLVSALTQYEAAHLFIDRAQLSRPRFAVTSENARTVAQLCHQLDGIPLAIELAAARTKVLSVDQIAQRLGDRFHLLTGGSRTALPRQQTLRATIDWSYGLLSETERALLRRLSVFAGGSTLAAAEAVASGEGVAAHELLDLLARLVDKSLVLVTETGDEPRFRLLETIRQYGADHLEATGEAAIWRGRHRDWFVGLAERAEAALQGPAQGEWLDHLESEHDNLRAALGWSVEGGAAEAGLRLAGALWRFWMVRGHLREGRDWLERVIEESPGASAALRAKAFTGAGSMAWCQGDYERATELHTESLRLYREQGDQAGIAFALSNIGVQALHQADYARAAPLLEQSLAICREMEDQPGIARALVNLGFGGFYQGDYARVRVLFEESLAIKRDLGDRAGVAALLTNLGEVAFQCADYEAAGQLYQEGLVLSRELGDRRNILNCLENLAAVATTEGQPEWAVRLLAAVDALRDALDAAIPPGARAEYERRVATARERMTNDSFMALWSEGRTMTLEQAIETATSSPCADHVAPTG